jgi:5-formyltetrahydrofolate cyclo-ligase
MKTKNRTVRGYAEFNPEEGTKSFEKMSEQRADKAALPRMH